MLPPGCVNRRFNSKKCKGATAEHLHATRERWALQDSMHREQKRSLQITCIMIHNCHKKTFQPVRNHWYSLKVSCCFYVLFCFQNVKYMKFRDSSKTAAGNRFFQATGWNDSSQVGGRRQVLSRIDPWLLLPMVIWGKYLLPKPVSTDPRLPQPLL